MTKPPPPTLESLTDAAKAIGVSPQAISKHYRNRETNGFPEAIGKVGQALVFQAGAIGTWWESRRSTS